jgi:hypothetical protein
VNWTNRKIRLHYDNDIKYIGISGKIDSTMRYAQVGVGHEFGHAFGNTMALQKIQLKRLINNDVEIYLY